jgi:outer membrane protein assembly factor BamB
MKLLFTILFISFYFGYAQSGYIAVITDPQIGPENNAMNLIGVVDDINKRQNIAQVVVLGNITANGKFDEFIWAQEILDGLTVPYCVVGGEKDYFLSEGKGSEISLLWGDDKNIFNTKNFSAICFNTFLADFPSKKYIDVETMNWLDDKLSDPKISRLLTFTYHPIQVSDNSDQFFEMNLNKKIFSFVEKDEKALKDKLVFEGLYLNRKEGWGYLLVSTNKDSIHIKKILSEEIKKKVKPEIIRTTFAKPFLVESDKAKRFIYPGSNLWSTDIGKSIINSSVYNSGKIYSVFKDGSVICLDNSGVEQWRFESNEIILIPPVIEDDLLILASDDGDIITLNLNTGNPHQIIGTGERISSGISVIDITGNENNKAVIVATVYGNVYCYDLLTLDPLWTHQLEFGSSEINIVSSIVHSDNKIFFFDNKGTLYCHSAANGMLIWKLEASQGGWKSREQVSNSQVIVDNNLYLIDTAGNLFCVDALLGTVKWNIKNINANGLIRLNNKRDLLLPTKNNMVVIVSQKLGKVISEIELPLETSEETITDLVVIGDHMIVSFSDGWIYKIQAKQKAVKIFRGGLAPIISLTYVDGNCLVTDCDGKFTLLKISSAKK